MSASEGWAHPVPSISLPGRPSPDRWGWGVRATARSWSHSSPNLPPTGRPDIRYPDSPVSPQYTTAFAMRPCRHPDGGHMDMGWVRFGAPSYQHSTMSPRPHSGVCVRGARSGGRPHRDPCWGVRPQGGDRGAGRGAGWHPCRGGDPATWAAHPAGWVRKGQPRVTYETWRPRLQPRALRRGVPAGEGRLVVPGPGPEWGGTAPEVVPGERLRLT